jgi:hypothetical protein
VNGILAGPGGPAARLNFCTAQWPLGRERPSAQLTERNCVRSLSRPGSQSAAGARRPLAAHKRVGGTGHQPLHHEGKPEEAGFRSLLGLPRMPVRVLMPIVVVDELDGLKKSKDKDIRWRVAYTLAVLDRAGHLRRRGDGRNRDSS